MFSMKGALVLDCFPSGRWGFVGHVPVELYWERTDGGTVSAEDAREVCASSNPSMYAEVHGLRRRVFASKAEGLAAAAAAGATVTQVVG